jgi:hypothetical protein
MTKTMTRSGITGSLALLALVGAAGCNLFDLSGPKLDENPNIQTEVRTPSQYLPAILAAQALFQEGGLARTAGMWMQHFAGVDRQYASYDVYSVDEDAFSTEWGLAYAQGGLRDIRKFRTAAVALNDRRSAGISKVLEALTIGTAASVWGDIPYSEAADDAITTPKLDKQLDVYAALQTLLTSGIADLNSGTGAGPGSADLIYGNDRTLWAEAAHSLKARYYLNTGETTPAAYALANAEAKLGISDPANDFMFHHSGIATEWNVWMQFMYWDRDTYLRSSATLVDTLKNRADPRLLDGCSSGAQWCAAYFDGDVGSAPGEYLGSAANLSAIRMFGPNDDGGFFQPIITWAETQLIIAETAFRAGNTVEALTAINAVRTASDRTPLVTVTLAEIMTEKWITMFQNIEVWSDWRRTCLPDLTPAPGKPAIPERLVYPFAERNVNSNIPGPSAQPTRNQNNPAGCT